MLPPTGLIPWFSKTEGNTYATLLHHPFLFKGKPTHAQEVACYCFFVLLFPYQFHVVVSCHTHTVGVYVPLLKFRLLETLLSKLWSYPDPFEFYPVCLCNLGVCGDWVLASTQVLLLQHVLPVSPSIPSLLQCSVFHLHSPLLWNVEVIHDLPDYPSPCFCVSLPKPWQINVEPCPANKSTHTPEPRACFIWFSWNRRL